MELKIYDKQGIVKMTVSPDNSSQWNHEVGVENVVTVNFTTWEFFVLEVGWYILVEGHRFSIKSEYRPKHIHNSKYIYNLKFYGREHDTQDILFCRLNQGEDDLESVFAYDGTPMDFLNKVVANMNRNSDGVVWKAGESITANRKTINFNGLYCWDALGEIARTFGTEWWMDGEYLNLSKCVRGESVSLGYGEGLKSGLTQNENTNAIKWFTRLIPVGSSKNIDKNTYGYANLQLPGREKYIDINTQYGLKEYREEAAFSEIYPHRVGTISSVRSETKTNEETGDYTVYYVKDSDLPFNPDEYMIDGKVINMTFNTGALAGKEFEVNWDNETGEFEIINQYPDDNTQLPGNYLVPSVGDAYVLSNISMPWNYNQAAEIAFEEAVEAYLSEYAKDVSIYSGNTDYIYVAKNDVPLLLGQRVRLISEVYFGNDGRESRITRVSRKLNNLGEASIDCSDAIASSWKSSVDSSLNQLQFVYSSQKEGATDKNLQILQTGDTGAPSDYNVYSALRSNKTFIRKDIPDSTPYPLGVGGLSFKGKDILRYIRKYDEDKPEEVTDVDFYSALMTEERIKAGTKDLDNRYLRKDKEDTAHKHITFEEGITVYELAKMMKLEVAELATIARAIVDVLGSSKFVDGFFGEGYQIWKSIATGDWCMTLDRLTVRKVMTVYELLIQKIRSVGGMIVVSAGNGKIKEVEKVGLEYKMTFEDTNTFAENDLMRCQVWTGTGVKYYWVEVVRVDGDAVYTRVADYDGVIPEAGDEVVLMGNTKNKLRQNLLILSATEDGQPRFDCLDGVRTKNFEGCLRTRVGCLDGISDDQFPPGLQPQGYGLYADNCYLRGAFVLSNGKDVQTQFSILEGMVRASMSSVQQQINAEDNYLSNASMTSNLEGWEYDNNVKVFRTSGGLLHFNGNFYSIKNNEAGIVPDGEKVVLRLKNSYIRQKNVNFSMHPTFDLVEQTTTDADGNEIGTGIKLYRPRMFYVSFRYLVKKRGTLRVYFEGEENRSDFEDYAKLNYTKVMDAGESFVMTDDSIAGKWNGTGDFYLSFDGEIYLYDLALADDPLSDMEERWNMKFELTEKKLELNFEHIKQQGDDLEAFYSEYQRTAEESLSRFTAIEDKADSDYKFLQGEIKQTASNLEISYTELIGATKEDITEDYKSAIDVSAREITAELTADLTDMESGLKSDYTTLIETRAGEITAELTGQITDLKDGDISTMKAAIEANAEGLSSKVEETVFNALGERVTDAESLIAQTASDITLMVRKDGVISSINQSAETITIKASKIDLLGQVTFMDLADGLQNTIEGKVDETTIISGKYIKTGLIDVDSLVVKKLQANNVTQSGQYTYTLDANGFLIADSDGDTLAELYVNSNWGYFTMRRNDDYFTMDGSSLMFAGALPSEGIASLSRKGLELSSYSAISNFKVGNIGTSVDSSTDFVVASGNLKLPGASSSNKGKVIFVRMKGNYSITSDSTIYNASDEKTITNANVQGDASSYIFISDGSAWYAFNCYYAS